MLSNVLLLYFAPYEVAPIPCAGLSHLQWASLTFNTLLKCITFVFAVSVYNSPLLWAGEELGERAVGSNSIKLGCAIFQPWGPTQNIT